jgi:hypothetical protein
LDYQLDSLLVSDPPRQKKAPLYFNQLLGFD